MVLRLERKHLLTWYVTHAYREGTDNQKKENHPWYNHRLLLMPVFLFLTFYFSFLMTLFLSKFYKEYLLCVQAICILKSSDFLKQKWFFIVCNFESEVKVAQSCLTVTPWIVVHGILQVRILEWVAFPFSRGSSQPRDRAQVSLIVGRFFTSWATGKPNFVYIL